MQWNSISEFWAMGGYAFYVWGSFGATAAVMVFEVLHIRHARGAVIRSLRSDLHSEGASQ